jgi:hypothetical protein
MSDVDVEVTTGAVTVNIGTPGAVGGGTSLTTLNALAKVSATGEIAPSLILVGTITGALTIGKSGTTARTVTFPDAAITVARIDAAQTFTGDQTFAGSILAAAISATAAAGVKTQAAATQDAVAIIGRAGGTGSYVASITPPSLSASITLTLPAVTGVLAILGANTFTGAQVFQDQITTEAIFRDVLSVTTAAGTTAGDATDHVVIFTGTTTQNYTLPACATGRELIIKNRSTGNVTVNRAGSDTIDGATSVVLTQNDRLKIIGNGTDWSDVS